MNKQAEKNKHVSLGNIRKIIEDFCREVNEAGPNKKPLITIPAGAAGSAAGLPFELWFISKISERIEYTVFSSIDFMKYIVENFMNSMGLDKLIKTTWWSSLQQFTYEKIERIQRGEQPKLQQALGDIVIKYGQDLNDIVLINVKATEVSGEKPVGRPPNIVSSLRLVKFLLEMFEKKTHLIDKVNVWLIGFYYQPSRNNKVEIVRCYFFDLFKLDLEKAPKINFDAAIQIQWHLCDMKEIKDLTLAEFSSKLVNKCTTEWNAFIKRRDEKLKKLTQRLLKAIEKQI
jgi:hypothetical protein